MNPLGICTWTLGIDDIATLIEKTKSLELDGIQYCGDVMQQDPHELRTVADAHGMKIFAIDPFDCAPSDPQKATTEAAVAFYRAAIDFAKGCGAPWVTLQGLPRWTANCPDEHAARERLLDCCRQLEAYATPLGVRLVYEVCNRYETTMIRTLAEAIQLLNDLGDTRIGLILDSFHMNIDEPDACEAIRQCGDRLASYHISDSNRAGIGSGHIDFVKQHRTLRSQGFDGPVMVELVLPHLVPTTPPRNDSEWAELDEEVRRSVRVWRTLGTSTI